MTGTPKAFCVPTPREPFPDFAQFLMWHLVLSLFFFKALCKVNASAGHFSTAGSDVPSAQ